MKQKRLDLNTKLEIICLCKVSNLSKNEAGRQCGHCLLYEEQRANAVHIKTKKTDIVPFILSTHG
jgi:hypothetical protein